MLRSGVLLCRRGLVISSGSTRGCTLLLHAPSPSPLSVRINHLMSRSNFHSVTTFRPSSGRSRTLFLTSEWPGSVRKTLSLPCQALVQTRGMGFWKEFVKNVREEVKKSDIKSTEDIKLLSEGAKRVSTGLSKAKDAGGAVSTFVRTRASALAETVKKGMGSAGEAIGTSVSKAKDRVSQTVGQSVKGLKDTDIVKGVETTVRTTSKAIKTTSETLKSTSSVVSGAAADITRRGAETLGQTRVAKSASRVVTDAYDFIEKERKGPEEINPEDVKETGIVIRKESQWEKIRSRVTDNSLLRGLGQMRERMEDSDSHVVQRALDIQDSMTSMVNKAFHTKTAEVLRRIREKDPKFDIFQLQEKLQEDLIPKMLEADVNEDLKTINKLCGERISIQMEAAFEARKAQGVRLESELIDISDVEFIAAQLSKGDKLPTCTFTFNVQQTFHLVNKKDGKTVEGADDEVHNIMFVWALTFMEKTKDWQIAEMGTIKDSTW